MADISRNTPHTSPPQRDQNPTRGNRRQRGGASANVHTDTHQRREKSGGRGGRGGGGRGSRGAREGAPDGRRQTRPQSESHSTIRSGQFTDGDYGEPPGSTPRSGGTSGDRLAGDAKRTEGEGAAVTAAAAMDEEADTGEVCFICASSIDHTAVAPCNHRTCHICALRLRALYKTKACAHCRVCFYIIQFPLSWRINCDN